MRIALILLWLLTLLGAVIWTNENPDKIEVIKSSFKTYKKPEFQNFDEKNGMIINANSYDVSLEKIFTLKDKTAFIINNKLNEQFNINDVTIFTQSGYTINSGIIKKIKLSKNFHLELNGGIKTIFKINDNFYSLISSKNGNCYYAAINDNNNGKEIFNTDCLPYLREKFDFNGLGSSIVNFNENILISLGTPTRNSDEISSLAQDQNSFFGKILSFEKEDFKQEKIQPQIYSKGHRTPQGMTKLQNKNIFAVEHGPKGGDELNLILSEKNYGWPLASYGTKYFYDDNGKSYQIKHEGNNYEEPLFAFVPSIGISAINNCPKILKNFYKKNCLLALSLYGNELRQGKSLVVFLLNDQMNRVHSIEKIFLGDEFPLRHFITNDQNEIYFDSEDSIYVSVDNEGIYKINFINFR